MITEFTYDAGGAIASMPDTLLLSIPVAPLGFKGIIDNGIGAQGHTAGELLAESQLELSRLLVKGFSALESWEHPKLLTVRIEQTLWDIQYFASLSPKTLVS